MTNKGRRTVKENIEQNKGPGERSEHDKLELYPVIEHLIIQGLNDTQIAKETGIDRKAVAHIRKQSRPAVRHPVTDMVKRGPESDRVDAEILRLASLGMTYVEIAEQVELSWTTVRVRLTKQYKQYLESQREIAGARQVADMEIMRNQLLEIIIKIDDDEIDMADIDDALANGDYKSLLKKVSDKAKNSQDSKFKAMEILIKLLADERKMFGLDAAANINVNHNVKVDPQTIDLLQRIEKRAVENVVEAEIIDDDDFGMEFAE